MQRYRPDIWWPGTNEKGFPEPEPRMAEDSDEGEYYAKDEVDRIVKDLRGGLKIAAEWLETWGSAEPYLGKIEAILAKTSESADQSE